MSPPHFPAKRIQAKQSHSTSEQDGKSAFGIAALVEKIGMDGNMSNNQVLDVDPESLVNSMCDGLMFQDMPDIAK